MTLNFMDTGPGSGPEVRRWCVFVKLSHVCYGPKHLFVDDICMYIYIYMSYKPKFRLESSIRAIFIFWKLSWGLENVHTLFKN